MVRIEQLAKAAVARDALSLRSLSQDWLAENPRISDCAPPTDTQALIRSVAAALAELFAFRAKQAPPSWTKDVGDAGQSFFLVQAAEAMPRLRRICEEQSPMPLRKRKLFAPPNFLEFV